MAGLDIKREEKVDKDNICGKSSVQLVKRKIGKIKDTRKGCPCYCRYLFFTWPVAGINQDVAVCR
jgi:hypothetical protein